MFDSICTYRSSVPLQFLVEVYTSSSSCLVGKSIPDVLVNIHSHRKQDQNTVEHGHLVLVLVWTSAKLSLKQLFLLLVALVWPSLMYRLHHHLVFTSLLFLPLTDWNVRLLKGMIRGTLTQSSTNPLEYSMTMTWTPGASTWGKYSYHVVNVNKYAFFHKIFT